MEITNAGKRGGKNNQQNFARLDQTKHASNYCKITELTTLFAVTTWLIQRYHIYVLQRVLWCGVQDPYLYPRRSGENDNGYDQWWHSKLFGGGSTNRNGRVQVLFRWPAGFTYYTSSDVGFGIVLEVLCLIMHKCVFVLMSGCCSCWKWLSWNTMSNWGFMNSM